MPTQVLVEFATEAEAKAFAKALIQGQQLVTEHPGGGGAFHGKATAIGAFKVPTKFCANTSHRSAGYTRGQKYGWWVCGVCRLPTEKWADNADRWRYALGINLIPAECGGIQPKPGDRGDHDLNSEAIWRDLPTLTSKEG
jgi:hypothetical protein